MDSDRQRQFEDRFLGQLSAQAESLVRSGRGGSARRVEISSVPDGEDTVRDTLSRLGVYDREQLQRMPGRRAVQLRLKRPVLGGLFERTVARVRAQVLAPLEALVRGSESGPIDRDQVLDALARYELLPRDRRPTHVVFASPTGFTPEAQSLVEAGGSPTLALLGGREDGGWDVALAPAFRDGPLAPLCELETSDARLERLRRHLTEAGSELEARGVSLEALSDRLGLRRDETEHLLRQAVRQDPRLMTVAADNTIRICRTPLIDEGQTMSLWSRIKRMILRRPPTAADQVRRLTEQRVRLEQQRHDIDQQVDALETQERDLLARGAAAKSDAEKKQLAGKLARLRRDLSRQRTRAQVFNQQIDVIGTQVHHLTLTAQSKQVDLPSSEELAAQAAEAERGLSELAASADLAAHVEVGAESPVMAEEEASIMAEFDQVAQRSDAAAPTPAADAGASEDTPVAETPPAPPQRDRSARPEAN